MVHDIERSGAQLKDVELGLVDFPGEVERAAGAPVLAVRRVGGRRSGIARARASRVGSRSPAPPPRASCSRRMPRYAGVLLDLFGTLVLAEPERLPVLRIGATSVRTTVGALGTPLAAYAPGVSAEAFWHALAGVSEEMNAASPARARRGAVARALPARARPGRLRRRGLPRGRCGAGPRAPPRARGRDRAPAGAPGAPRRAARAPPRSRWSATSTTPTPRTRSCTATACSPASTRSWSRSRSGCGSRIR